MKATAPVLAEPHQLSLSDAEGTPWRPIHYLGSKLRALSSIEQALATVAPQGARVYDLFAGSGTVSRWLARSRPVTAVDIQEYSRVICSALLNQTKIDLTTVRAKIDSSFGAARQSGALYVAEPLMALESEAIQLASQGDPSLLADLLDAGSLMTFDPRTKNKLVSTAFRDAMLRIKSRGEIDPRKTIVLRHFGGLYFSFRQAAELDALLSLSMSEPKQVRDTLVATTLSCASELVNTVGKQFAQPIRPRNKDGEIKSNLHGVVARDRFRSTEKTFNEALAKYAELAVVGRNCTAVRSDYLDFLQGNRFSGGVVYADPPYTRDHYSRFYHVLETMALWDDPEISTNTVRGRTSLSRGAYRADRHQSPFCVRSQAPQAFEGMFVATSSRKVPVVLSYSPYSAENDAHPRVMTIEAIEKIALRHYSKVETISVGEFSHSRLNRVGLNKEIAREAEFLITCSQPR